MKQDIIKQNEKYLPRNPNKIPAIDKDSRDFSIFEAGENLQVDVYLMFMEVKDYIRANIE